MTKTSPAPPSSTKPRKSATAKPRKAKQLDLFASVATPGLPPGSCPAKPPATYQTREFKKGGVWVILEFVRHAEHWFCCWCVMLPSTGRSVPFNSRPGYPQPRQAFEAALSEAVEYIEAIPAATKGLLGWNPTMPD